MCLSIFLFTSLLVQILPSAHLPISEEQLIYYSILSYQCYNLSKNLHKTYTAGNTNINEDKLRIVETVAGF